ncbi:MAG: tRNA (guanosine(46)-N7)-methyltransferase TrmB [Alphaproteobacteria bacterium]
MGTSRPRVRIEAGLQALSTTTPAYRVYGRRKGRPLRVRKGALVKELLPKLKIDVVEGKVIEPSKLFSFKPKEIWLEIGFGGGEHLAAQAERNPTIGFIGCEPFLNGVASALDHIEKNAVQNVRIFPDNARQLLLSLPDKSIARCFILFADPWPKARHAERRFVGPANIPLLARVLKAGAELRLATDDPQLKEWMTEHMDAAKDFERSSYGINPPADWVQTRYEQKALKAGREPLYMTYRRK